MWSRHKQQQQCGVQFRPPPREIRPADETPATPECAGEELPKSEGK